MTSPGFPIIASEHEQLGRWIDHRITALELIMVDLKTSLDSLTATITDYTADVTAKLDELTAAQQAMQATLDAALSAESADESLITDLRSQLAAMQASTSEAVARISALDDAVKLSDQPVDRPTP